MFYRKLAAFTLALTLVVGTFALSSVDAAKNVAWEYQLIGMRLQERSEMVDGKKILTAPGMSSEFNFHGAAGWEYVNTIPGKEDAYFVVFRRQK